MFPGFDTFPVIHTILSFLISGGLLVWLLFFPHRWRSWFVPATLAVLFFLRLPSIVYNREINPDESQMITQALTLGRYDPVYFRSVDGTTGGPLDSYFLVLPSFIGLPYDYITAHLMAWLLVAVSLWFLYKTARLWFGEVPAKLALLPVMLMLGFTQNADFLHYNSELIAIGLLSWACFLYARQTIQTAFPRVGTLFLTGFLLGMVPFGKLQGVPLAVVVGGFVALDVLLRADVGAGQKTGRLAALAIGALAFPALFVGFMAATGELSDFVTFYIEGNFRYASGGDPVQNLLNLPRFFGKGDEFFWLVFLVLVVGLAGLLETLLGSLRRVSVPDFTTTRATNTRLLFLITLSLATIYSITRTGSEYVHYLYFLIGPIVLWLSTGWQLLINRPQLEYRLSVVALNGSFLLFLGWITFSTLFLKATPTNPYSSDQQGGWRLPKSALAEKISQYAQPGEPLVVWGWRCDYYVETQMPQGVAENHTIRSTFAHPMLTTYQQRYVRDFYRSFPPVFVDAVGKQNLWMTDRKTQGHELIKPLGAFVKAHYKYVGETNDARVYVRFDRINGKPETTSPVAVR